MTCGQDRQRKTEDECSSSLKIIVGDIDNPSRTQAKAPQNNDKLRAYYQHELAVRTEELSFLCLAMQQLEDTSETQSQNEISSSDSTAAYLDEWDSPNSPDLLGESNPNHIEKVTFEDVQIVRTHNIKAKEKLFRKPKIRQYYYGNTLYRSSDELRTSYTETFTDLLYISVFYKAGLLVQTNQTWESVKDFVLIMIPAIIHWERVTLYNQSIHHGDFYHKIHTFILSSALMIMGNTCTNAFNPDPVLNTSGVFLTAFCASQLYLSFAQAVSICIFNPQFSKSSLPGIVFRLIASLFYLAVVFCPINGTQTRETLRQVLWFLGIFLDINVPIIILLMSLILPVEALHATNQKLNQYMHRKTYRIALNFEHTVERHGGLYVIAIGTVAASFLYDAQLSWIKNGLGLMMLALLIAVSLNTMYFRAEGRNHFKHALVRSWFTNVLWRFVHTPLVLGVITLGVCMANLVQVEFAKDANGVLSEGVGPRLKGDYVAIYFTSHGVVFLAFVTLRLLHLEEEVPSRWISFRSQEGNRFPFQRHTTESDEKSRKRRENISSRKRALFMASVGISFVTIGFVTKPTDWSSFGMLGFGAAVTTGSMFLMEWGILKRAKRKEAQKNEHST
ncbi:hypothetical protein BCR33DRAFT_854874 [Rhizoclosmatium globosum]|uniref:Uncharacterized protein n=1 Tax=Rhizoclosmatium globosum TaxID=329046 RepID=A0A1Y2BS91_9FUNG|nr:hypothetical protein BCR33DRAFT_854874 [Rhizoclosmatium globosum]|eukprot:ORY36995.1 hypothetical protein BCR33DRAFT_854874 [Rhizoclosmatium globosum]